MYRENLYYLLHFDILVIHFVLPSKQLLPDVLAQLDLLLEGCPFLLDLVLVVLGVSLGLGLPIDDLGVHLKDVFGVLEVELLEVLLKLLFFDFKFADLGGALCH